MESALSRLRKSGGIVGLLADVTTLLLQNWVLVVAALVSYGLSAWSWAFRFLEDSHTQVFGSAFLFILWGYIGLSVLYRMNRGIKTVPAVEYAHSIVVEGISMAVDTETPTHPMQLLVAVRSVCLGPMRVEIQDLRVILAGRTIPDSPVVAMIIPRLAQKGVVSGVFNEHEIKPGLHTGSIDLHLRYGPTTGDPVRMFRLKANLNMRVEDGGVRLGNTITSEEDCAI